MTKHKENSKRASLDSVFWILFPGAFGGKMFTWLIDTNGDWVFTMVGDLPAYWVIGPVATNNSESYSGWHQSYERGHDRVTCAFVLVNMAVQVVVAVQTRPLGNPRECLTLDGCTSTVAITLRSSPRSFRLLAARFYSAHA